MKGAIIVLLLLAGCSKNDTRVEIPPVTAYHEPAAATASPQKTPPASALPIPTASPNRATPHAAKPQVWKFARKIALRKSKRRHKGVPQPRGLASF